MSENACEICGDTKSQRMNWRNTGWRCDRHPFYKLVLVASGAVSERPADAG